MTPPSRGPRQGAETPQTRRDRFIKVATTRVTKVQDVFDNLAKLGNPNVYAPTERDVEVVLSALDEGIERVRFALSNPGSRRPTLEFDQE
jgi:hypothetical protein